MDIFTELDVQRYFVQLLLEVVKFHKTYFHAFIYFFGKKLCVWFVTQTKKTECCLNFL